MTERAPSEVFKRVVYHEFPHGLRLRSKPREKRNLINFASAFANKSTIVIRTFSKWNSCGSKPAALLFRENTCRYAAHKGITHCYYHVALVEWNISKWTECRVQIFGFYSMSVVAKTIFSNWKDYIYELYNLAKFLFVKMYCVCFRYRNTDISWIM